VSTFPRQRISGPALAWIGCGGTILALAFTLRPVHASPAVFWTISAAGAMALLVGCGVVTRRMASWRGRSLGAAARRRQMLASECHRLHEALVVFAAERDRERPKPPLWIPNTTRDEEWRSDTVLRYRDELRAWAIQVFDEVVACGATSPGARPLVQSPAATQLGTVRDLFRDAALSLEGS
jgi:hypothetical protein